jgi:hypothetical protein
MGRDVFRVGSGCVSSQTPFPSAQWPIYSVTEPSQNFCDVFTIYLSWLKRKR